MKALLLAALLQAPGQDLVTVEVATVGIGIATGAHVVILHDPVSDRTLPIWVGPAEADAIARSLNGVTAPRPMTHDLLSETIRALGATVTEILVHDLRDGVYFGSVHLEFGNRRRVDLDSRPSDAVALALRAGAPIRVARRLLEDATPVEVVPPDSGSAVARAAGLTVVAPTAALRKAYRLPEGDGVVVLQVEGTDAKAIFERGDFIREVDGVVPKSPLAFFEAVRAAGPVGAVRVRFWRNGAEQEATLPVRGGRRGRPAQAEA